MVKASAPRVSLRLSTHPCRLNPKNEKAPPALLGAVTTCTLSVLAGFTPSETPRPGTTDSRKSLCSVSRRGCLRLCPRRSQQVNDPPGSVRSLQLSSAWKWFSSFYKPAQPTHPSYCLVVPLRQLRSEHKVQICSGKKGLYLGKWQLAFAQQSAHVVASASMTWVVQVCSSSPDFFSPDL